MTAQITYLIAYEVLQCILTILLFGEVAAADKVKVSLNTDASADCDLGCSGFTSAYFTLTRVSAASNSSVDDHGL